MLQPWIVQRISTPSLVARIAGKSPQSCILCSSSKAVAQQWTSLTNRRSDSRQYSSDVVPLRKQLKVEAKKKRRSGDSFGTVRASVVSSDDWELTVGIEIHAQLNTACKLFSEAETSFNAQPNSKVEPFDVALPGTQPHFQIATLLPALRAAIALRCDIQPMSRFDRKHYFYHDQPAGYQITQYYEPFAKNGYVKIGVDDGMKDVHTIQIKQIQMEQDTAKSQEQDEETNLIDFNRAGHPLIEIISLPEIHSPEIASAYVKKVQALLLSVDAVTAGMEQGGLRADVNVSVRRRDGSAGEHSYSGIEGLGQRTEIKNLSTIKAVEDAIKAERTRQISVLEAGGAIEGETRGWSLSRPNETRRLRGKEGEVDYRYMPDPDIPPLYINGDIVEHLHDTLPALPDDLFSVLVNDERYELSPTDARILLHADTGDRLDFYQETVDLLRQHHRDDGKVGKLVANWVLQEVGHTLTTKNITWEVSRLTPEGLASLLRIVLQNEVTGTSAKHILGLLVDGDPRPVNQIVDEEGLRLVRLSEDEYVGLAQEVMAANSKAVQQIEKKGQVGKMMFLVGQMIRQGPEGRVEAKKAEETLRQLIQLP